MRGLVAALLVLLAATAARAGADLDAQLLAAEEAVRAGDLEKATGLYAREVAAAQRRDDLLAEEQIARGTQGSGLPATGDAVAGLMKALEAPRAGAYVSAHLLAIEIVLLATREGDTTHLKEAAAVLDGFARAAKSGKCADAMQG